MKKNSTLVLCFLALFSAALPQFRAEAAANWTTSLNSDRSFVENKSQFNGKDLQKGSVILFGAQENDAKIYFTKSGLTYRLAKKEVKSEKDEAAELSGKKKSYKEHEKEEHNVIIKTDIIRFQWLNSNPNVELIASEMASDYYTYNIASKNIIAKAFKKLVYKDLYPGIDVEYVFHPETGIEYSIIVHPGADASQVKFKWTGADQISDNESGNISIATKFGDITDHAPVTFYQHEAAGVKLTSANPRPETSISSRFVRNGKVVSFELGNYDRSKTIVIDPWTVSPGFNSSNSTWEIEADASGNVYAYGGEMPIIVKKYNSAGALQWSYNTPWDTTSWIGTLRCDPVGTCYITLGSTAEIERINTNGTRAWHANGGAFDEYWGISFNCDYTQLLVGGTRLVGLPLPSGDGKVFNINMTNGAVISSVTVGKTVPSFLISDINEVRSIAFSPNGKFYFHTLDTIGELTAALGINWRLGAGYSFAYTSPYWAYTSQPQNVIAASLNYVYTMDGKNLYRRDITTGALINSVAIPGGNSTKPALIQGIQPRNNGLELDSCGNVYVGSGTQIHKYDAALNLISSATTPSAVYDLDISTNGDIVACGKGYIMNVNMTACNQVAPVCVLTTPLTINVTNTNPLCGGACTGTGTATPTSGTGPYTYAWSNSQTSQTATGLCAGTYNVTVTDASSSTATSSVVITQPTALSGAPSSTPVTCYGLSDGTAGVTASGGTPGYTYNWNVGGTNSSITNKAAGTYTVTITDSKGCTTTSSAVVTQPGPIVLNFKRDYYICGESGSVQLSASGGTSYLWQPGATLDDSTSAAPFANPFLPTTTYTVTVTNGSCSDTAHVTIHMVNSPAPPTINQLGDSLWVSQGYVHYQWYFQGIPLAGDTNFYILVHTHGSGNYSVYVTDTLGCKVITQNINAIDPTGISAVGMQNYGIEIFPNPTGDKFDIRGLKLDTYKIEVYDALGQKVYQDEFTGNQKSIKSKWSTGVYFIEIKSERESYKERIMIK